MKPSEIAALIARVEAATGADRALSNAVCVATGVAWVETLDEPGFKGDYMRGWFPDVTDSLDKALSLARHLLPQGCFMVESDHDGKGWAMACAEPGAVRDMTDAPTPALALILATLKAIQAAKLARSEGQ